MAAAVTIESAVIAILILIPLFFAEKLSAVRPWVPLAMPAFKPLSEPPRTAAARTAAPETLFSSARIFHGMAAPRVVPTGPVVISDDAPASILTAIGTPEKFNAIGAATAIPEIVAPRREPEPVKTAAPSKPVQIGGDVQAAKLVRKIVPAYPEIARRARISGTVRLVGVIAKDGTIEQLQVVSGNPLLIPSALDAVRQWVYRPTLLNGIPVEVIAPIDVIFSLRD